MFLSYRFEKYLGYNKETDEDRWQYRITDSDFIETSIAVGHCYIIATEVAVAIIDTYERRNLNVAANLLKAVLWANRTYHYSMTENIYYNNKFNPKFSKYEKDLEKYLVLI